MRETWSPPTASRSEGAPTPDRGSRHTSRARGSSTNCSEVWRLSPQDSDRLFSRDLRLVLLAWGKRGSERVTGSGRPPSSVTQGGLLALGPRPYASGCSATSGSRLVPLVASVGASGT